MESFIFFLFAVSFLAVLTLVGHGLWLLIAAILRTLFRAEEDADPSADGRTIPRWKKCPQCQRSCGDSVRYCNWCGLDYASTKASELADLSTTAGQLDQFRAHGALNDATWEDLQKHITVQRRALILGTPVATRIEPSPVVAAESATVPLWKQLEVLAACQDVRNLTLGNRLKVIADYRRVSEDDLAQMSAHAQLNLARVLNRGSFTEEALHAYRRLLLRHPQDAGFAEAALEAGRLAATCDTEQARWFLERALAAAPTIEGRTEAQHFLERLDAHAREEVLEVLPVNLTVTEAVAPVAPVSAIRETPEPIPALVPTTPSHCAEDPGAAPMPDQPRRPRRSLTELLAGFMEERNILWGELVGGLLMVGCSIALVIYLWKTYSDFPYFPLLIFTGISVSLFGAGLYALHRLQLDFTGRSLLVIATLLVPLNCLVMAGLSRSEAGDPVQVGIDGIVLALLAVLIQLAARGLAIDRPWLLTAGVLGSSASQLLVSRFLLAEPALSTFVGLAVVPVVCFSATVAPFLLWATRQQPLSFRSARSVFELLGCAGFALAVALGLLINRCSDISLALERVAIFIALAGIPVLAAGLLVHRGLAGESEQGAFRTAGTGVALLGMAVMLLAGVFAWPQPLALLLVCTLDFVVLTVVAFRFQLPAAHGAALPCVFVAYLTAVHRITGDIAAADGPALLRAAFSAQSGAVLVMLAAALGGCAEWLGRIQARQHAMFYAVGAAVTAGLSLALVTWRGVAEPGRATVVYAIYGVGFLAANARWRSPALTSLGLGLLVGTTLWSLWWSNLVLTPAWGLVLAVQSLLVSALTILLDRHRAARRETDGGKAPIALIDLYRQPLPATALASGFLALGLSLFAPGFPASPYFPWTAALLGASALIQAWVYRHASLAWIGSALLLGSFCLELRYDLAEVDLPHPWVLALLAHASVMLFASLLLRARLRAEPNSSDHSLSTRLRGLFVEPLAASALASSLAAIPLLILPALVNPVEARLASLACLVTWLAVLWLVIAGIERWPGLFTAFQAAVSLAVVYGVTAWLQAQGTIRTYPDDLFAPHSLQTYGVGLGCLALLWVLARVGLRSYARATALLEPDWPALDRVVLGGLVIGQAVLAIWVIWPDVLRELAPPVRIPAVSVWGTGHSAACGVGGWVLLGTLAVVLVAALWERYQTGAVLGLLLLALTVPVLAAGAFAADRATASALRWGLAGAFLAGSVPFWRRDAAGQLAQRLRIPLDPDVPLAALARPLLLCGSALPVICLTAVGALIGFSGPASAGPASDSLFGRIGWVLSNVVPMAVVSLGLVGHALRERSAGYAFAAGLVANATLTGGYALQVVNGGRLLEVEWVRLIQVGTLGTAAWAIAWLVSRPWVCAWRERSEAPAARPLMTVQLSLAAAGNALLLAIGVGLLIVPLGNEVIQLANPWYGVPRPWTTEAGSALGWLALGLTIAAVALRNWGSRSLQSPLPLGWLGLLLVGLLACSAERGAPGWGYRTLMVGWAGYALAWALLAGWRQRVTVQGAQDQRSQELSDAAALFVSAGALLAVLLGLNAALVHHDRLWAAAAIALASPAGALLAVQRRREHWAFTAGLGINLAASLLVWHTHTPVSFDGWWAHLVQANVIATATGALLWLAMRRNIYGQPELSIFAGPLLAAQVTLGFAGNALLLGWPLLLLVAYPPWASSLGQVGEPWGWLALILAFAASLWYCDQIAPSKRAHIVVVFGLALGVLTACALGPFDTGNWLSFHVVTALWCMTGLLTLAAGWIGTAFRLAGSAEASDQGRATLERIARLFPADLIPRWISAIGLLVVGLALRGIDDPYPPYASAAATLIVSTLFGGLALWSCRQKYVYASGLLINLVGILVWLSWREHALTDFVSVNVSCLAIASAFWSAVEWALRGSGLRLHLRDRGLPFCHLSAILAQLLLVALVGGCVLAGRDFYQADALTWGALELTALAMVLTFWDAEARFTLAGLYSIGLLTAGMLVLSHGPHESFWSLCLLGTYLAAYVLLTAALRWEAPMGSKLWQSLRIPARVGGWPEGWFAGCQVVVAVFVAGLSVGMALGFPTLGERLVGSMCVGILIPAGVVLTSVVRGSVGEAAPEPPKVRRSTFLDGLAYGTLALGVLAVAEVGWAVLERDRTFWLHGGLTLMVALAIMTPVYGIGLGRLLPAPNRWGEVGRKLGPRLGALATLMLVVVLMQEGAFYSPLLKRTPLATPAVLIMVGALVVLMAACISFAVVPGRDPFGLTEGGRMLYVYACELLMVFLFLHLKLTRPEWFGTFGAKYWTFLIMALAFLGVGLGEWFQRRGLHVLAEPLQRTGVFLPLLPLLAFWTRRLAPAELIAAVGQRAPAMRPLLDYIDPTVGTRIGFDQYAMLWALAAALLTLIAVLRRSFRYSLLAALAANFGWWSLLYHYADVGLAFVVHPQLWLIPLALIVLAAEYLNRDRLTAQQSGTLRYLSLMVIYVSSTADMFIAGLGESIYMPLLLAVLSVVGVLSGILLRVRAFLFLGVTFLFLVVFTMIWHAAVGRQQYWVWWVSGILLGGGIIALFALFEKRRNELLQLVDELKSWK